MPEYSLLRKVLKVKTKKVKDLQPVKPLVVVFFNSKNNSFFCNSIFEEYVPMSSLSMKSFLTGKRRLSAPFCGFDAKIRKNAVYIVFYEKNCLVYMNSVVNHVCIVN